MANTRATTRLTTAKKTTAKIKPTKEKKPRAKKQTATGALNTYKSVKTKILGTKEGREESREKRKEKRETKKIKSVVGDDYELPEKLTGKAVIVKEQAGEREESEPTGIINRAGKTIIRRLRSEDDADEGSDLNIEKDLEGVTVSAKRPAKKTNYLLYILVALAAYLLIKKIK